MEKSKKEKIDITEFFFKAVEENKKETVKMLIDEGFDINVKDKYGWTALNRASYNDHIEIVKVLLEAGADIDVKDKYGYTALLWASENGFIEIIKLLLEAGADVNSKNENGWTALMKALDNGYTKIVKLLLEAGADVNAKDNYGETVLLHASKYSNTEAVKLLLKAGADINAVNKEGNSVLDIAKKYKNKEIVTMIDKEIKKNKQTKEKKEKVIKTKKSKDVFNSIKNNIQDKRLKNLLLKRIEKGISSYGTRLTTYNGRDALKDAHEEVLDAILYIWQKKMEISSKDEETLHKLLWILNNLFYAEDVIKELRETPNEKKERIDKFCDALNKISLFK